MEPSPCTPPCQELPKDATEFEASKFGGSHNYKTNNLSS